MWFFILASLVLVVGFVAFTGAPYVPSRPKDVERALTKLYPLGKKDLLVDIGSGDGIVLRIASRHGAKAYGLEIHPLLVVLAKLLSRGDANVTVRLANFWRASLPQATTVVYTFGEGRDILKMYQKIQTEALRLNKELAFISYAFEVPGITPRKTIGAHHLYYLKPLQ